MQRTELHLDAYAADQTWRAIQQYLPAELRLGDDLVPASSFWPWEGHQIHLERFARPESPVTVILLHGVGTNGRQLSLIAGGPLFRRGIEAVAVDLPPYGQTRCAPSVIVTYDDWVRLVCALITEERERLERPIVLFGLSAGGMLVYHAAAIDRQVAGIIGTTFLDQREQLVRDATALNLFMSRVGGALAAALAPTPLGRLNMPMRLASKMHTLVNDPAALRVFLADPTSTGNWASLRFLHSYLSYQPAMEPEDFDVCPILLTQPAEDRWTPQDLSELFLRRLQRMPVTRVLLEGAGHYPLEEPGLTQLADATEMFIQGLPVSVARVKM
jgi:alpha-beta hydrolase superfamily lysophospholipase